MLQRPHLVGPDEVQPELTLLDALVGEYALRQRDRRLFLDLDAAAVCHLDRDHRYRSRCVPVSSAWSLYASTIRCTSRCRTTSSWPKRMNAIPSIEPRMS